MAEGTATETMWTLYKSAGAFMLLVDITKIIFIAIFTRIRYESHA